MRTRAPCDRCWEEGSPQWAVVGVPERPPAGHEGSEKASQGRRVLHLLLMNTGQGEGGGGEVCSRQRKRREGERQTDCAARGATHRRTWQTHQHTCACTHVHAHTHSESQMWGRSSILKEMRILIPRASVSSRWSGLLRDGFHGNSLLSSQRLCKDDFQRSFCSMAKVPSAPEATPIPALVPKLWRI